MTAFKKIKQQEIPFILDGKTIIKSVYKNTTCSDVIRKLPNIQTPLAVFKSVDGVEKELEGKTKILHVWRAFGSSKKVEFVIRKSHMLTKDKKSALKMRSSGKNCKSSSVKSAQGKELSKDTLKQVSDLAFYVRYQKTKVQALKKEHQNKSGNSEQNRLMKRMTLNASVNSMDAFLAKADLNEMAKFLNFCGEVTAEKLGKSKPKTCEIQPMTSCTSLSKHVIDENLKSKKLGLKERFAPKRNVERSTSTGTISSTDTGYCSVGSESEGHNVATDTHSKTSLASLCIPKRHTFVFSEETDEPKHSTPIFSGRTHKRRQDDFESTFTADNTSAADELDQFDELQGKTMILEKFMADQTMPVSSELSGSDVHNSPDVKRRRIERYSMPVFCSQKDACFFSCDTDSEFDVDISQPCESLDLAFNEGQADADDIVKCQKRTLRRESAISNLNRFSFLPPDVSQPCDALDIAFNEGLFDADDTVKSHHRTLRRESAISNLNRFSLLSRDIGLDTFDETNNAFDYSFDCSFPRMDETQSDNISMDFSCDFDDSDSETDSISSLMKTRSFMNDESGDITLYEDKNETNYVVWNTKF